MCRTRAPSDIATEDVSIGTEPADVLFVIEPDHTSMKNKQEKKERTNENDKQFRLSLLLQTFKKSTKT